MGRLLLTIATLLTCCACRGLPIYSAYPYQSAGMPAQATEYGSPGDPNHEAYVAGLRAGAAQAHAPASIESTPYGVTAEARPVTLSHGLPQASERSVSESQTGELSDVRHVEAALDGGSRSILLERYQQAVADRTALEEEVTALSTRLQKSMTAFEEERRGRSLAELEAERLREQVATLDGDFTDLAARLATAQIRRLEAERDLLVDRVARELRQAEVGTKD